MLPDQHAQMSHFVRLAAEVNLAVNDSTPIEILTQSFAVWAAVSGEYENGVERDHPRHPTLVN
jgi:hypothetical protein